MRRIEIISALWHISARQERLKTDADRDRVAALCRRVYRHALTGSEERDVRRLATVVGLMLEWPETVGGAGRQRA